MADSAEINAKLKDKMEEVAMHLFPTAKIKGNIAHVGGIDGEAGDSFQIHVKGARCGMFIDFANPNDKGGSPLWLWSRVRGVTYKAAVSEAKKWLGLADTDYGMSANKPKKEYSKPDREKMRLLDKDSPAMDYMVMTRKIDPAAISKYKVSETESGEEMIFPYIEPGELKACHFQYLKVERGPDGKKFMRSSKGTKPILWGMHTISEDTPYLIITEGQSDCLSWSSLGFQAVSLPGGVQNLDFIDICWAWLERFEVIYLSFDMDDPGAECCEKVSKRLGLHRCKIVKLPQPNKDMNDYLVSGATAADAQRVLDEAKAIEIKELQSPTAYLDEVWNVFHPSAGQEGYATPWWPQLPFRVKPAELTVLSGYSGAGKTCWINNLIISIMNQGGKVLDCSLEIKPARTLQWMARQALNKRTPSSKEELESVLDWLSGGVWLFDYVGTANIVRMFEAMLYAVKRHGVNVIFIDSLFKCGIGSDDYNAQKEFIAKLCDFARDTGVHIFLVAHTRKPPINTGGRNEDRVPSKDEIAGSADIQNGAFNILVVWRNKEKHKKLDELRASPAPSLEAINKWEAAPDGRVKLDKSRFDGIEREVATWFDLASTQFTLAQSDKPVTYFRHTP